MAKQNQKTVVCEGGQLDARLNDYSAVTRISAAAKSVRSRAGNWPIYAAAAGSALAMSTNASASLIYCGASDNYCESVNQHPVPTATSQELPVTIPLVQSTLGHHPNSHLILLKVGTGGAAFGSASLLSGKVKIFDTSANVKNFASRAPIGSQTGANTAPQAQGLVRFKSGSLIYGNFAPGVSGIAGFAITGVGNGSLASQHNQTDYGWIRLRVTGNQAGDPIALTAVDWAFQTDGSAVEAGQVPEPGTTGLSLLALGAVGIAALKRRRKPAPAL